LYPFQELCAFHGEQTSPDNCFNRLFAGSPMTTGVRHERAYVLAKQASFCR
jgi:hypothetical protein